MPNTSLFTKANASTALKTTAVVGNAGLQGLEVTIFGGLAFGKLYAELFPAFGVGAAVVPSLQITAQVIDYLDKKSPEELRDIIFGALHSATTATIINVAIFKKLPSAPVLFECALILGALRMSKGFGEIMGNRDHIIRQLRDPELLQEVRKTLETKSKEQLKELILAAIATLRQYTAFLLLMETGTVGDAIKFAEKGEKMPTDLVLISILFILLSVPDAAVNVAKVAKLLYSGLTNAYSSIRNCLFGSSAAPAVSAAAAADDDGKDARYNHEMTQDDQYFKLEEGVQHTSKVKSYIEQSRQGDVSQDEFYDTGDEALTPARAGRKQ